MGSTLCIRACLKCLIFAVMVVIGYLKTSTAFPKISCRWTKSFVILGLFALAYSLLALALAWFGGSSS